MYFEFESIDESELPSSHQEVIRDIRNPREEPVTYRWVDTDEDCVLYMLCRVAIMSVSYNFLIFFRNKPISFMVEEEFLTGYRVSYICPGFELQEKDVQLERVIKEGLTAYSQFVSDKSGCGIMPEIPRITFAERYFSYWRR
jgi:hypothetical protein